VLHPQILTRATEWPSLASVHPTRDGGPPRIFLSKQGQKLAKNVAYEPQYLWSQGE